MIYNKSLICGLLFLFANNVFAVGEHCLLKPSEIAPMAKKIFTVNKSEKTYFPNESTLQMDIEADFSMIKGEFKSQTVATVEGFYRPDESNLFSVLPIPLFVAQLERERDVVYICAHNEELNPSQNYIIVYFLKGYRISKTTFATFVGDMFFDSIDIKPISLVPIATLPFRNFFEKTLKGTPFVILGLPVDLFTQLQNVVVSVLSLFTGIGVERITVTDTTINLGSGIDFNNPTKSRISVNIPFKK